VSGLVLTSIVRRLAPRYGLVDQPDGHRKLHDKPIPLGGGLAVFLAATATVSLLPIALAGASVLGFPAALPNAIRAALGESACFLGTLAGGSAVIVVVGLLDDRLNLRPSQKLAGQIVAASVAAIGILGWGGLENFQSIQVFGGEPIRLGYLVIPLTLFWLLGAINSVNLLDGVDGLATTLGIILCVTFALMAGMAQKYDVVAVAVVFAGVLVGFLRFNFPPARIFLGDAGSMLIGLVAGALAIRGSLKEAGTVLLAAPLAVWAIPVFDSGIAILRRRLRGRSIYSTDRSHRHHSLLQLLGSNHRVLGFVALCCAFTSGAALLSVSKENDLIAWISFVAIALVFITTGVFGRAEALLLADRLRNAGLSLVQSPFRKSNGKASQLTLRLHGSKRWELLWETLTESADKLCLSEIRLDVNLPADGDGFHALWRRSNGDHDRRRWRIELPLLAGNRPIGGLLIVGQCYGDSACLVVEQLLAVIEPFEVQLASMTGKEEPAGDAGGPIGAGAGGVVADEDIALESR